MRLYLKFLVIIMLFASIHPSRASDPQQHLHRILKKIQSMDTYTYTSVADGIFPGGNKDRMHTTVCVDKKGKRMMYKTDWEEVLLTREWFFKADIRQKTTSVLKLSAYQKKYPEIHHEIDEIFKMDMMGYFIDSVLLKDVKIHASSYKNNMRSFTLKYPEDIAIQEIILVFNETKQLPENIKIKFKYGTDTDNSYTYEIECKNYSDQVAQEQFNTARYFTLSGNKVHMKRYTDYKLSTML